MISPSLIGWRPWRLCFRIAEKLYAKIDEEGRTTFLQHFIEAWGISAGDRISVDQEGTCLQLRPAVMDVCKRKELSPAHKAFELMWQE